MTYHVIGEVLYDWLIISLLQIFIEFCSGGAVDDIIVGKKDLLSSLLLLFRFLRNAWNVIRISWYDELFFITKRFRVTVDTT